MHIEPEIVTGTKILLSYATGVTAAGLTIRSVLQTLKENRVFHLIGRSLVAFLAVFVFFQVLPHYPVGVSEVHFILGSTLFLIFGPAAAALGLAGGLLFQGIIFAPFDLPQYGMNVTTLLLPLFAMSTIAKRIIPENTAYVDIHYHQVLRLSLTYQGGIIAWVAFWAFYGQGFTTGNLASVASFGGAYLTVVLLEPLLDLAALAAAKAMTGLKQSAWVEKRLFN
ncbi:cobalt transporter [Marinomonas agarivorans]|nr:cobalt transporter [Marinomonas agarivorans]